MTRSIDAARTANLGTADAGAYRPLAGAAPVSNLSRSSSGAASAENLALVNSAAPANPSTPPLAPASREWKGQIILGSAEVLTAGALLTSPTLSYLGYYGHQKNKTPLQTSAQVVHEMGNLVGGYFALTSGVAHLTVGVMGSIAARRARREARDSQV